MDRHELAVLKQQVYAEIKRLEAQSSARKVAGKSIGNNGLGYITLIIIIGVGASLFLEQEKMAAVMGLLGAALTALISMLNEIAGSQPKPEKPEFEVIKHLIEKLDKDEPPMHVNVVGDKVIVRKGADVVTATTPKE
jgi:hypothetical protein